MIKVKKIESAIKNLSKDELTAFREWFEEFDAILWDEQFEKDISSGKLDRIAKQVISDFKAGKCNNPYNK